MDDNVSGVAPENRRLRTNLASGRLPQTSVSRRADLPDPPLTASRSRPFIGGQLGSARHNPQVGSGGSSMVTTSTTTNLDKAPWDRPGGSENIRLVPPPPKTSPPQSRLPKSRTLNVLSNISQSFSRASLTSRTTSRNVSITSTNTAGADSYAPTRPPLPSVIKQESESDQSEIPAIPQNPHLIYTAQTSAYWTGRFVTLHDRFQDEVLSPNNLTSILAAHAGNSPFDKTTKASAAGLSKARAASSSKPASSRLRASLTSNSILQRSNTSGYREAAAAAASAHKDVSLLCDEDTRCRRVFLHLEAMCVTNEAHRSLHAWQQSYARKVGREALLPRGGSMEDRGFVRRFFSGGRRSLGSWGNNDGLSRGGKKTGGADVNKQGRGGKRVSIL